MATAREACGRGLHPNRGPPRVPAIGPGECAAAARSALGWKSAGDEKLEGGLSEGSLNGLEARATFRGLSPADDALAVLSVFCGRLWRRVLLGAGPLARLPSGLPSGYRRSAWPAAAAPKAKNQPLGTRRRARGPAHGPGSMVGTRKRPWRRVGSAVITGQQRMRADRFSAP